jgi:hypothetical protein
MQIDADTSACLHTPPVSMHCRWSRRALRLSPFSYPRSGLPALWRSGHPGAYPALQPTNSYRLRIFNAARHLRKVHFCVQILGSTKGNQTRTDRGDRRTVQGTGLRIGATSSQTLIVTNHLALHLSWLESIAFMCYWLSICANGVAFCNNACSLSLRSI